MSSGLCNEIIIKYTIIFLFKTETNEVVTLYTNHFWIFLC